MCTVLKQATVMTVMTRIRDVGVSLKTRDRDGKRGMESYQGLAERAQEFGSLFLLFAYPLKEEPPLNLVFHTSSIRDDSDILTKEKKSTLSLLAMPHWRRA